jgi:hypothetical protein
MWPDRGREFLEALTYSNKINAYIYQTCMYILQLFMKLEREAIPDHITEESDGSVEVTNNNQ